MPLYRKDKEQVVEKLNAIASNATTAVVADYIGVEAKDLTALRAQARELGVNLSVVRNTLARLAFEGTDFNCLRDSLVGPSMIAFSTSDPGAGARLLKKFAEDNEKFTIKALSASGQALAASEIDRLATMPTREQALAQLLGTMQAPMVQLVRGLNDVPSRLVRTLAAVRDARAA